MNRHVRALGSMIVGALRGNVPPHEDGRIRIRDVAAAALYDSRIRSWKGKGYGIILPNGVNVAYFTCGSHFKYLRMSLKSIEILGSRRIGDIILFVDRGDPFSKAQVEEIKKLKLNVHFLKGGHVTGWGIGSLANQLEAYRKLARDMPDNYLLKMDSDTLLVSDGIFKRLGGDCVGSPCRSRNKLYKYNIQGGAYFIRKGALEKIAGMPIMGIALGIRPCPEDLAVHHLLSTGGRGIRFVKFHLPFRKRRITGKDGSVHYDHSIRLEMLESQSARKRYSAVHFWMEKEKMRSFFERYFGVKCADA